MTDKLSIEPFGYFKSEPFGWTDCAENDECAQPLFDLATVHAIEKQRDELLSALIKARYDMAWTIVTLAIEREPTQREIEKAIAISTPDSDIGAISKAIASVKGGES